MKTLFVMAMIAIGILVPLAIVFLNAKLFAKQRLELVTDWKTFFKRWSLWLTATGVGFGVWLNSSPQLMIDLWHQIPDEWKASIPQRYVEMMPFVFIIASAVVTNIRQQKLAHAPDVLPTVELTPTVAQAADSAVDRPARVFIGTDRL